MPDISESASRMIERLRETDPDLDTSVGTTTRKIIDVVAEQIAEMSSTRELMSYRFDLDSKRGADLDDFALLFGLTRFPAGRARGVVTFYRPAPAPHAIYIPAGTQVGTSGINPFVFATVAPAYMPRGADSTDVPIRAVLGGEAGNLQPNEVAVLLTGVEDISAHCANLEATRGGTDEESDAAFIERFKRTVFRSLAGTESMLLGAALEVGQGDSAGETPSKAKVIGTTSRWREQIQIDGSGKGRSSIPAQNIKYIFEDSYLLGTDILEGHILTEGIHYSVDVVQGVPEVTSMSLEVGEIYDFEFEYTSMSSRNEPGLGISNRADIWTDGVRVRQVNESFSMNSNTTFTNIIGSPYRAANYRRWPNNSQPPAASSIFTQLTYGPITGFPEVLSIAGNEYVRGTNFHIVHEVTAYGFSPTSRFGIEWVSGTSNRPANGTEVHLEYYHNEVPRLVEQRVRRWRLVTSDVRAHQGIPKHLRMHLAVVFNSGVDRTTVASEVHRAVSTFITARSFGEVVQVSDVLLAAKGVVGVDSVHFTTSDEPEQGNNNGYGIQHVSQIGTHITNYNRNGRAIDVWLMDNEYAVLHELVVHPRAQNSHQNWS